MNITPTTLLTALRRPKTKMASERQIADAYFCLRVSLVSSAIMIIIFTIAFI